MRSSQEQLNSNQERVIKASPSATEQLEKLDRRHEAAIELSPRDIETQSEEARTEALRTAVSVESKGKDAEKINKHHTSPPHHGSINRKQRNESYRRTMKQVQSELSISSRIFSKITHNKVIEKTSDIIGNTIARPNAMLSGAVVAFVLTLTTYITARAIGYVLSGFETIVAFTVGWTLGIVYDYIHVLVTGKKS